MDKYQRRIIFGLGGVLVVAVIAAAAFLIPKVGGLIPANPVGSPEFALSTRMERQQPLIDILRVEINNDGQLLEVVLLDLDPDGDWSEADQSNMVKAIWMAMEFAADRELSLDIAFWRELTAVNAADQEQVEIYYSTSSFVCDGSNLMDIDFTEIATASVVLENCYGYPNMAVIAKLKVDLWTR